MSEQRKLEKLDYFLQKLKKVVHIVLYGPVISQSDCMKAGPYQLPIITFNEAWALGVLGPMTAWISICLWGRWLEKESFSGPLHLSRDSREPREPWGRKEKFDVLILQLAAFNWETLKKSPSPPPQMTRKENWEQIDKIDMTRLRKVKSWHEKN